MEIAEETALAHDPDFVLWLNDDTDLTPNALEELLLCSQMHPYAILVGAVTETDGVTVSYGGMNRAGWHPQRLELVEPVGRPRQVDAFNGNCVLISRSAFLRVGRIDGDYEHAYADIDYSARARSLGVPIVLLPGFVGVCPRDTPRRTPDGVVDYWKWLHDPKGRPWRSQARYLRKHGGPAWPAVFLAGYLRVFVEMLKR